MCNISPKSSLIGQGNLAKHYITLYYTLDSNVSLSASADTKIQFGFIQFHIRNNEFSLYHFSIICTR